MIEGAEGASVSGRTGRRAAGVFLWCFLTRRGLIKKEGVDRTRLSGNKVSSKGSVASFLKEPPPFKVTHAKHINLHYLQIQSILSAQDVPTSCSCAVIQHAAFLNMSSVAVRAANLPNHFLQRVERGCHAFPSSVVTPPGTSINQVDDQDPLR